MDAASKDTAPQSEKEPASRTRQITLRVIRWSTALVALAGAIVLVSASWVSIAAAGHLYDADDAPEAPVVIVLGSQVRDGKPMKFLAGRLDAAVQLVQDGKVRAVLVSGDANGRSGNEIQAMTEYLVAAGVDPDRIVGDEYGLDTYDTCARAVQTYGVTKALIVSQGLHVSRAVALCRDAGIDVDGVEGACECNRLAVVRNYAREWLARPKAVLDLLSGRDPAVVSPPDGSLATVSAG
ncbi:YdcF family protein [Rhodococcus sp. ABRD24]|uniref:SanA/YdcF family protein n=1 Tax=Rhodococcus sp. ABRD24 TaxID=2507582 RepID=UPI00103D531E|nr:ElyC/SanA/YdcF family protein [Rhodococcus sp. ABRD24]QBJ96331.1 YdcF family protein [Rhodococcus sp. ABRD24]